MKSFCQWAGEEVGKKEAIGRVRKTGKSGKDVQTCLKVCTDIENNCELVVK